METTNRYPEIKEQLGGQYARKVLARTSKLNIRQIYNIMNGTLADKDKIDLFLRAAARATKLEAERAKQRLEIRHAIKNTSI